MVNQVVVSSDGVLYTANSQAVDSTKKEGGLERALNPTHPSGATFETVTRGLSDNSTLNRLWVYGSQLWSLDTKNTRLMTYLDTLTQPVALASPVDKAAGVATGNVRLTWVGLKGATKYQWQVDYDNDFSSIPADFEGYTDETSARLPALDVGTAYYWRVRVTEPVLSPWSAKWSFTTILGNAVVSPELQSPRAGATGVPTTPVFQWSAMAGAERYELLVSADVTFVNPIIARTGDSAIPATAWRSDVSLNYATTYYWKVRASGSGSYSAWSAVGAFTTEAAPVLPVSTPSPSPSPSPTPSPAPSPSPTPTQSSLPNWAFYLMGLGGLIVILLLVIILMLVLRRRSS